jgi:glyoxylase-like metal-dependent hydrolase (beta-lactamase superfamily II)/rhodanese-related sulfurtransferase
MYFKQILDERCGCASYLIASRQSQEAAIIDPSVAIAQYDELLTERDYRLRYVIDTHVHADHISGARSLAAEHGADLCLHASAQVTYPFRALKDAEDLELGQLRLHILHTPGHRREMVSILVINPPRSPEPSMVITGDCLLVGDVGRPDFGGGDAKSQYESVTRLLRLPDWVAVFPGHFEGPCGRGMCGRPSTTIGFERLFNPLARLDAEPFVSSMTESVAARPLNMTAIEATNRGVADLPSAMLTTSPHVDEIDVQTLARKPSDDFVLLDVREPQEYAQGHVPGAVNVPQADVASRLEELPRDRPLVTICQHGARSLRAAQFLKQSGFSRVESVSGGTEGWRAAGKDLAVDEAAASGPNVVETEWAHAGASAPAAYTATTG